MDIIDWLSEIDSLVYVILVDKEKKDWSVDISVYITDRARSVVHRRIWVYSSNNLTHPLNKTVCYVSI